MIAGDCKHCKDYRECKAPPDWFDYSQIRWCPFQIIWLLRNKEEFWAGRWPRDPNSPDDNVGSRIFKSEAYFAKPELVWAELKERLDRCGEQAELLITQIEDGRDFYSLSSGAREVLMYCQGFPRRKIGFKRWLRKVYYRHGENKKINPGISPEVVNNGSENGG